VVGQSLLKGPEGGYLHELLAVVRVGEGLVCGVVCNDKCLFITLQLFSASSLQQVLVRSLVEAHVGQWLRGVRDTCKSKQENLVN
jgi:hypothetical protein